MKTEVTHQQFKQLVLHSEINSKIPALVGASGFGKTSALEYNLLKAKKPFLTLVIAELLDSIEVIPDVINGESTTVLNKELKEIFTLDLKEDHYIILDEIHTLADYNEEKLVRFRQLILERRIGTALNINKHIKFILLGNRAEDTAHGLDFEDYLPNMVMNNIAFYDYKIPTIDQWMKSQRTWNKCKFLPLLKAIYETYTTFPAKKVTPRAIIQCCQNLKGIPKKDVKELFPLILDSYFEEYSDQIKELVIQKRLNLRVKSSVKMFLTNLQQYDELSSVVLINQLEKVNNPSRCLETLIEYNAGVLTKIQNDFNTCQAVAVKNSSSLTFKEFSDLLAYYKVSDKHKKMLEIASKFSPNIAPKSYIEAIPEAKLKD